MGPSFLETFTGLGVKMKQKVALALSALVLALGGLGWVAMDHMPTGCDTVCAQQADGGTGNGALPSDRPTPEETE